MSYANRKQMSGNRTAAIVFVALLHLVLGYALVTGLAYNVIKKATEDLKTFDVEEEPPPPEEEPPPPPPDQPEIPPPPSSPPPIVRTNTAPPPIVFQEAPIMQRPAPVVIQRAPPAPPPTPPPAKATKAQSSKGSLQGLFNGDDYPQDALRDGEEGRTTVRLTIGTTGRVSDCQVTSSSGSRSLDNATCRVIRSRARFTPAKNSDGSATTDTYTQSITWRLQ